MTYPVSLRKRTPEEKDAYMMGIITENVLLKKQIAEANKILSEKTDHEYGTVAYADFRQAQIERLRVALKTGEEKQ